MKKIILVLLGIVLCGCSTSTPTEKQEEVEVVEEPKVVETDITLNIVGDITLGNYAGMTYNNSFDQLYAKNKDTSYFLKNVKDTFAKDDLTIANLEGTLTTASSHMDKKYNFKGLPEYAKILTDGNIDIVSVANNHSYDYFEKGRTDTKANLDKEGIEYFGYEDALIKEVKGKKIGFIGYSFASQRSVPSNIKTQVKKQLDDLKDKTDVIVVYYHWGMMYEYTPTKSQIEFAHYTIDQGADLLVGTHAHIIQGMETYKGKNIVYSLGNFCYGGSLGTRDNHSMIFQQTFHFEDDALTDASHEVIPASMTSASNRKKNNFQPMLLTGDEKTKWEKKFKEYCNNIKS